MILTIVLWVVGGALALLGVPVFFIGVFRRDVRESQFGGDTWRASIVMGAVGVFLLWHAWHR